jgi:hypothetical protein
MKVATNPKNPLVTSVWDPYPACHFNADRDLDPTFHFYPDPDPIFQIKAQNLEKVQNRLILARHLQINADLDSAYLFDADLHQTYHFDADADPNPDSTFQFDADLADPDLDPQHC